MANNKRSRRRKSANKPVVTQAVTTTPVVTTPAVDQTTLLGQQLAAIFQSMGVTAAPQIAAERRPYVQVDTLPAEVKEFVRDLRDNHNVTSAYVLWRMACDEFNTIYPQFKFLGYSSFAPGVERRDRRTQNEIAQNRARAAKHGIRL